MRHKFICGLGLFMLLFTLTCFSQQEYVSRFDAFGSYSFLSTPSLNLMQNGFNAEFGWNVRRWVALGGDFSVFTGSNTLIPSYLAPTVQARLAPIITQLPTGYTLAVPANATIYTYSAGPQLNLRKLKTMTFFVRPALGALHADISLKPGDPVSIAIVTKLIGPGMKTSDTVVFYGFGGGMDLNVSKHVGIRTAADFVHYDMFSGLLNGGRNSVRFSVGPTFRFGPNVPN